MGPMRMQLVTCALLGAGGAGLLAQGYFLGGGAAIGLAVVLIVMALRRPGR